MEHDLLLTRELLVQRPHDPASLSYHWLIMVSQKVWRKQANKDFIFLDKRFYKEPSTFGRSSLTLSSASSVLNHLHVYDVHTSLWCSSRPPVQPQRPSTDVLSVRSLEAPKPSQSFPYSSPSSSSLIFPVISQLLIIPPLSSGLSAVPLLSLPTDLSSCSHSSTHNFEVERKNQKDVDPESWRVSSAPLTFTHFTDRKCLFQRTDKSATAFIWPIS